MLPADTASLRSAAAISAGYGLYYLSFFGKQNRWQQWLPALGGYFLVVVGALSIGRVLFNVSQGWFAEQGIIVTTIARILTVLMPIYCCAIGLQLVENVTRRVRGLKPNGIRWANSPRKRIKPTRKPYVP